MCCVYRMNRPAGGLTVVFCGRWSGKPGPKSAAWRMPWQKSGADDGGKIPTFSCRSRTEHKGRRRRLRFTRPCGAWPYGGFQLCGLSAVCGLCRASILAGLALMQGYASPLRSPGPSFPSAVIFRSFAAQVSRPHPATPASRVRQAAASLAPLHPRLFARLLWRHGTARCRGICEQRRKTSCNMRNLSL